MNVAGKSGLVHNAHHLVVEVGEESGHTVFKGVFLIDIQGLTRYFA